MKCNYHTHTTYCDGKEEMKIFVQKALELQFDHLGFSSHAPILKENKFQIISLILKNINLNFQILNYLKLLKVILFLAIHIHFNFLMIISILIT